MTIRDANRGDVESLAELAATTYAEAFGHSMLAADLAAHLEAHLTPRRVERMLDEDVVLVAETAGALVGFVQIGAATPDAFAQVGDQELRRLYVAGSFQNQGVGTRLLEAALMYPRSRVASRVLLDVWEENPGARRLYERFGFRVVGVREFVVASGAPTSADLVMVRETPG